MPAPKGHPPYPGCEKGGTPKIFTDEVIDDLADILQKWGKDDKNIFIEDFCLENDLRPTNIHIFQKKNEKFARAYEKIKLKQKTAIFKGGLSKKFSFPMCALLLYHNHGISQQVQEKIIPNDEAIDSKHENMLLRAEIDKLKAENGNKSEARQELCGGDTQV
jgi:hypothetical protein